MGKRRSRLRERTLPATRGYYKPTPLRWPFLVTQMALLAAVLGVLVVLQRAMPDSDNSAIVDGRPLARSVIIPLAGQGPVRGSWIPYDLRPRSFAPLKRQTNDSAAETTSLTPAPSTVLATVSGGNTPITTTSITTTSRKSLPKPTKNSASFPNGAGAAPSPPEETTTYTTQSITATGSAPQITTISGFVTTISEFIGRSSAAFADGGATLVVEAVPSPDESGGPDSTSKTDVVIAGGTTTTIAATPPMKTDVIITGGTTTAIAITATVTPSPHTTTDAAGRATVVSPLPVQTLQTVTGVIGGHTVQTVRPDDGLTAQTMTMTVFLSGSSVTLLVVSTPGQPTTQTLVSVVGGTTVTVTPQPETFVRLLSSGVPTTIKAVVDLPTPYVTTTDGTVVTVTPTLKTFVRVLSSDEAAPITTITSHPAPYVTIIGGTTTSMVVTTTPGRVVTTRVATTVNGTPTTMETIITITPTPTPSNTPPPSTNGNPDNTRQRALPGFTQAQYLAITFLPTLLATTLSIPFTIIATSAKQMLPFRALAKNPNGSPGRDTLTLGFRLHHAFTAPFVQAFGRGEPVPLVACLGAWLSALLAPLAAEAVGFKVHGTCSHLDIKGCGISPGVSPGPANALVALLGVLLGLMAVLLLLLGRWETGVHADPWPLAGVASLSMSAELRRLFEGGELTDAELEERLRERRFRLAVFEAAAEDDERYERGGLCYEYGIVPVEVLPPAGDGYEATTTTVVQAGDRRSSHHDQRNMPFLALRRGPRVSFSLVLVGLIALLAYYFQELDDSAFELFMDSQGFGVKFLFALLGTIVAVFWHAFFEGVAAVAPFSRMARSSRPATRSVLLSPATNVVSGAAAGVRQRDFHLLAVSIMAGAAELLLPALLANVPFALTQTYAGHVGSTIAALVLLGAMLAVLVASLVFVRWPHLPVDPRTLAGAIYYVVGSRRLRSDLRGRKVALRDRVLRDAVVVAQDRRYVYGPVAECEPGGSARMGVEVDDDHRYRESG